MTCRKKLDFVKHVLLENTTEVNFQASEGNRSEQPLDLVHSDVCGKMNASLLGGAEYFLTFDDRTHYVWVYTLKHKDEVFDCFMKWKVLVEKSSGQKLKVLRTDNGGEYTSKKFENYLKSEGIRHERTVPKTPEQNGMAKRTLVETVRSMLADAKLPHRFWAEALSTAVYLRNRSPTKAVQDMTPFEAWKGMRPRVDHLCIFGCDAYSHVPKDERQKLDSKARKCILLGYGEETKDYRLYDSNRQKVFHSRDVKFNEVKHENEHEEAEPEKERYVELDFSDNEVDESITDDYQNEVCTDTEAEQNLQRSESARRPPDFYGVRINLANDELKQPVTAEEALAGPENANWLNAMEKEKESLHGNNVWTLVELPKDRKPVGF